jgi:hypothetical protein
LVTQHLSPRTPAFRCIFSAKGRQLSAFATVYEGTRFHDIRTMHKCALIDHFVVDGIVTPYVCRICSISAPYSDI